MAKILLIEDEGLLRGTLRSALEAAGHSVVEAANGREGLELLGPGPFDVVITDILMPVMEGIETIMAIKRTGADVKVVAISGASQRSKVDFLQVAHRLGADEILHKPFPMADLIDAVARCLAPPTAAT
jgi:CheY-like chemotaxis protein